MPEHPPTHTVIFPWPVRGTDREDRVVTGAVAAGWVADRLGVGRPETLRFESSAEFESARDALERVLDGTNADPDAADGGG